MSFDIPDWGGSDGFSYGVDSSQFCVHNSIKNLDLGIIKKEASKKNKKQITANVEESQQPRRKRKPDDENLLQKPKKRKKAIEREFEKLIKEPLPKQTLKKKKETSHQQSQLIVKKNHRERKSGAKVDTPICATLQNPVVKKSTNKYADLNIRQKEERNKIIQEKNEAGWNVDEISKPNNDGKPVAMLDMKLGESNQKKTKVKDKHGDFNRDNMGDKKGSAMSYPTMEDLKIKKKKKNKIIDQTINQREKKINKDETKENIDRDETQKVENIQRDETKKHRDETQKVENIQRDETKKQSNVEPCSLVAYYSRNKSERKRKKKRKIENLTLGGEEGEIEEKGGNHTKRNMNGITENEVKLKEGERDGEVTGSSIKKKAKVTENRNLTKEENDAEEIAGPTKKKRKRKKKTDEDRGTVVLENLKKMNNKKDLGIKTISDPDLNISSKRKGNCVDKSNLGLYLKTMDKEAVEDMSENRSNMKLKKKKKKKSFNSSKILPENMNNKTKSIEKPVNAKIKGTANDTNQITKSKRKAKKKRREVQSDDNNIEVLINDNDHDIQCDDHFKSELNSIIMQLNFDRFNKSSSKGENEDSSNSNWDDVNSHNVDDGAENGKEEKQVRSRREELNNKRNNNPTTKNTSTKNHDAQTKEMHKADCSGNQKDGKGRKTNRIAGKRLSKFQREKVKLTKNLDQPKTTSEQHETSDETLKMERRLTAAKFSDSQAEKGNDMRNHNPSPKTTKFSLRKLGQYLDEANTRSKLPTSPAENLGQHLDKAKTTSKQPGTSTQTLKEKMEIRLTAAKFRHINEELYTNTSQHAARLFLSDTEAFSKYHQGYQDQVRRWPFNPLEHILQWLNSKPKFWVVADLGCGEAILSLRAPQTKVHSFDFVASNPRVTACDMANTHLGPDSVDVVVFCLSLMGTNIADFIAEANRILRDGGIMKIAEVESRFGDTNQFVGQVGRFGFHLVNKDVSHSFFHLFEFKKNRKIKKWGSLPEIKLKPCVYKRC